MLLMKCATMIKTTKQSAEATITTTANNMLNRSKLRVKANCKNNCNSDEIKPPTTLENNFEISSLNEHQQQSPPLKKLSLRGNQLCGSILIGNYNYLTQLEVCENEMEVLDLSSLAQLETLKCSYNKLIDLILNGSSLQTLIANHNKLHSVTVNPVPVKLSSIDISYNQFSELPNWIGACVLLQSLLANHNHLTYANSLFDTYRISTLRVLNLSQNCLQTLDRLPEACESLKEVYLQSNELQCLPENFFAVTRTKLIVLNVSCNRLLKLPLFVEHNSCVLEELFISGNQLNDYVFDTLIHAHKLRKVHAAYNRITELPEACVRNWCDLEELVLAGNMLQQLPENIETLNKLQVLRVHSNLLLSTPTLSKLSQLKVLDLAHNHLDRVNLLSLVPKNLKYLDLSANLQLSVDEQQLKVCQTQSQKHWSLIDVSGKNRDALPTTHKLGAVNDGGEIGRRNSLKPPWLLGFAETPGNCRKLMVSQLRQPVYHIDEGLFGMFECFQTTSVCSGAVNSLAVLVPHILQEQSLAKNSMTTCACLKYTLIKAQQRVPACITAAAICHVAKEQARAKNYVRPLRTKRFVMRVVSIGPIGAYLIRRTSNYCLTQQPNAQMGRLTDRSQWQAKRQFLEPEIVEISLTNDDEYFVLGNAHLFSVLDIERIAREIRKAENALLAAKRIQDIAQSFGASENLSVIVVRFRNIGTDVEHLIKELKQSVRKKSTSASVATCLAQPVPQISNVCKRICCYRSNACQQRSSECSAAITRSERSSPSGQSDQLHKEICGGAGANDEFILAHARVLEEEEQQMEMLDETDSVLSEEQFKCWEYMLEQNTQLLFDKELNTISKSFTKNRNLENKSNLSNSDGLDFKSNLIKGVSNKLMSISSPQLLYTEKLKTEPPVSTIHQQKQQLQQPLPQLSFLSKHFGSNRSVQQITGCNLFDSKSRDSLALNTVTKIGGGPNAAYFGSLQRLMPYNLEFDFAVTRERNILDEENDNDNNNDEYIEHESRMRKYWGVATTEL